MKNQKSLTNKGFSLVELIIVVAIMAVLIGVLAPQYLRYVEKSRLQKDNTSIAEIADVIKMMSADETLVQEFNNAGATGIKFTFDSANKFAFKGADPDNATINGDLAKTLGTLSDIKLSSNTYTKNGAPELTATVNSDNVMTVKATGWFESVPSGDDPKGVDKTF